MLERERLHLPDPPREQVTRVPGATELRDVRPGIARPDVDHRVPEERGDARRIDVQEVPEGELGLEVLGEREVDHRVGDVDALPGGELRDRHAFERAILRARHPSYDEGVLEVGDRETQHSELHAQVGASLRVGEGRPALGQRHAHRIRPGREAEQQKGTLG